MSSDLSAAERLAVLQQRGPQQGSVVEAVRDGEAVVGESTLSDGRRLEFEATNLRPTDTGVHARLEVSMDDRVLAFSIFNLERDEDRTRFANSAAKRLGDIKQWAEFIKGRLDAFCAQVWIAWTRGDVGSWEDGSDRRTSWLVEPFILEGAGTILYGPPSTAKSWVTMLWSLAVTHRCGPWPMSDAGPMMLVNLERPPELVRVRIRECARVLGCPERMLVIHGRGRSLSDVEDAVRQTVRREGCSGVVVDSLSRAGTGDLTGNQPMNRAMDSLNSFGTAWCIISHTPRSDSSHIYGSVMAEAAADLCIRISGAEVSDAEGHNVGVKLETTKANDVRKGRPQMWSLRFGMGDEGLQALERPAPGQFIDLEVGAMTLEDRICDVLRDGTATTKAISDELDVPAGVVGATCRRSPRICRLIGGGGRGHTTTWALQAEQKEA